jgi:hypothetical protein
VAVGDAPASVVHRAAEASRHPVARRLAGAIPAAVAQHPAGRRSAGLVACQVAEARRRAGRPAAVRQPRVAEEEVLSAGHATAPRRPVEAVVVVAVLRDARVRPLPEAAVGVPAARHAEVLPRPGVAEAGGPAVQHVAQARPREVAAVQEDAEGQPRVVAVAAGVEALRDAAGQPAEVAAVQEDAEGQPRVVAVAAGVEALRDAAGQPEEEAAVPAEGVVRRGEGAPAACPEPAVGRLSVAVSVCHRGRPRPAARPPGPRRRARPGQRKGSSQSTSLSVRSWQAAPNEFWSCDFRSRNHFGEGEER